MPYDPSDDNGNGSSSSSGSSSKKSSGRKDALKAFGRSLSQQSQAMMESAREQASRGAQSENERSKDQADRELERAANAPSYHRGGTVRKTGLARLEKGERVIPRSRAKKTRPMKRIKSGRMF